MTLAFTNSPRHYSPFAWPSFSPSSVTFRKLNDIDLVMEPEDAEDKLSILHCIRTSDSASTLGSFFARALQAPGPGGRGDGSIDPDATALLWLEQRLSFDWLQRTSNALAHVLQDKMVSYKCRNAGAPVLIGVCLQPSPSAVATLSAVMKTGYAYVPFDESYPDARVKAMVEGCGLRLLVTDASCREQRRSFFEELGVKEIGRAHV